MNGIATRLQVGTAALAIAAATTMVPIAAQAAPEISAPTAPVTQVLDRVPEVVGLSSLPEISFFWFGAPNPNPAPPADGLLPDFPVLGGLSRFLDPVWAALGLNGKEFCLLGADVEFNLYGGVTVTASARAATGRPGSNADLIARPIGRSILRSWLSEIDSATLLDSRKCLLDS